jgi:glucose-1-phosphate adenylyltransferase
MFFFLFLTKKERKKLTSILSFFFLLPPPPSSTGINKIYVMTQFNSTSLNRHLARTYNVGSGVRFGGDGFVEVLAATQTPTDKEWFQGTADAVRQYAWLFSDTKVRIFEERDWLGRRRTRKKEREEEEREEEEEN